MARTGLWKGASCYMHRSREVPTHRLSQGYAAESLGKKFRHLAQPHEGEQDTKHFFSFFFFLSSTRCSSVPWIRRIALGHLLKT